MAGMSYVPILLANTALSTVQQSMAARHRHQAARQDLAAAQNAAERDLAVRSANFTAAEENRIARLRRAEGAARASASARGLAGPAAHSLILGLVTESDREQRARRDGFRLRTEAVNQSLRDRHRRNLLDLTQQREQAVLGQLDPAGDFNQIRAISRLLE